MSLVQPGDTVVVKSGVYRENVEITASGTAEKRITLKAAPASASWSTVPTRSRAGGNAPRKNCTAIPTGQHIYCAQIDWKPVAIFVNGKMQTRARWPKVDKTMYRIQGGDAMMLVDPDHLTQPAGFWETAQP